jgi:hypothetical protein
MKEFENLIFGSIPNSDLGKVGVRLEFENNNQLIEYLTSNRDLDQFVKVPKSKNPSTTTKALTKHLENSSSDNEPGSDPEMEESGTGIYLIPLNQIHIDHANFQNRETEFSAESVERILDAIRGSTFRWAMLDPITLYRNPTDSRLYILSGHSRYKAFQLAAESRESVEGRNFNKIPARIFTGSMAEAIELARNSNNLSTKETELERANFYREKRNSGMVRKDLELEAKKFEGRNASFVLNLSCLNPNGNTIQAMKAMGESTESENSRAIKDVADWIGESRRKMAALTDTHENELYTWLMNGAYRQLGSKRNFIDRVSAVLAKRVNFGITDEYLNIENRSVKSSPELKYEEDLENLKKEYDYYLKERQAKEKEFVARGASGDQLQTLLVQYQANVENALRRLTAHVNNREAVKDYAKNQMSIFGLGAIDTDFWELLAGVSPSGMGSIVMIEPETNNSYKPMGSLTFEKGSYTFYSDFKLKKSKKLVQVDKLNSKDMVADFLRKHIYAKDEIEAREVCHVLFCDTQNKVMGCLRIAEGGLDYVAIDIRLVFAAAFTLGAQNLIITHNHPSGSLAPSDADLDFTKKLNNQCKFMGVRLLDHIILTNDGSFSFASRGYL